MINFWKKQYEQETPIPAKFLLPDGSITDTLPGGGGGSMDNYYNKREVNDLLDEVANNASQEIANQINDTSSDRNHTLSSAEVDSRISDSITDVVESGNEKGVTSNAVNGAIAYRLATDCNACIPTKPNTTQVYVLNKNASNLPAELTAEVSTIIESKYSYDVRLGLYRIAQDLTSHYNPIRKYTRRGYSLDGGVTWTWNDWEKLLTESDNYQKVSIYTTNNSSFSNTFAKSGIHEIFILDISDKNKWIKLIYSTNGTNYTITKISNRTLEINTQNAFGTIVIKDGSGNYKAFETFYD